MAVVRVVVVVGVGVVVVHGVVVVVAVGVAVVVGVGVVMSEKTQTTMNRAQCPMCGQDGEEIFIGA